MIPLLLLIAGAAQAQETWSVTGNQSLATVLAGAADGDTIEISGDWSNADDETVGIAASITIRGVNGVPTLPPVLVTGDHDVEIRDVAFADTHPFVIGQPVAWLQTNGAFTATDIVLSVTGGDGLVLVGTAVEIDGITASGFTVGQPVSIASSPVSATLDDGWFEDCAVGALALDNSVVLVEQSVFQDNGGTDITAVGGELFVDHCEFNGSDATLGGALAVYDGELTVLSTDFTNVNAGEAAVAVVADTLDLGPYDVLFDDVYVDGATADATVGAIALAGDLNATIADSTFIDTEMNGTDGQSDTAGAIVIQGGTLDLDGSTIDGSRGLLGGAVAALDGATLYVTEVVFTGTSDDQDTQEAALGGAIAAFESNVVVTGASFVDLTASVAGGAVWMSGGQLELYDSVFDGTQSKVNGGAVWLVGTNAIVDGADFLDTAALDGGAWHQTLGSLDIHGSRAIGTHAGGDGGAMVLRGLFDLKLHGNLFCEVTADQSDVVRVEGGLGFNARAVHNNRFVSNTADGGATLAWRIAIPTGEEPLLSERTSKLEVVNNSWVGDGSAMGAIGLWWGDAAEVTNDLFKDAEVGLGVYDTSVAVNGGYNLWYLLNSDVVPDEVLPGPHAVYDDPEFADDDPYRCDATHYLATWSPARDAGDPGILDVDGTRSDIGAWGGPWSGLQDRDFDGWLEDADCNDLDADINPTAEETWYDGVDQDCDGNDLDADWDGYDSDAHGGDDCNDGDDTVHPGAYDDPDDNIDQNCDGTRAGSWLTGSGGCAHAGGGLARWWFAAILVGWRRRNASR